MGLTLEEQETNKTAWANISNNLIAILILLLTRELVATDCIPIVSFYLFQNLGEYICNTFSIK